MKNIFVLAALFVAISSSSFAQTKADKKDTTQHITFYTCPMHPDVKMDKPGKCPVCGMDLNLSSKEQIKKDVTKTYSCPIHVDVVSNHPGKCSKCGSNLVVNRQGSKQGAIVYTCSMHPDVASDKSGKCPICGMTLIEKKEKTKTN